MLGALGAMLVAWIALSPAPASTWETPGGRPKGAAPRWKPELVPFQDLVANIHGRALPPAPQLPAPPADQSTRPPLSAYTGVILVREPGKPAVVGLRCKDPAHADFRVLELGLARKGWLFEDLRVEGRIAYATVSREEERFTFELDLSGQRPSREVIRMPRPRTGGGPAESTPPSMLASAPAPARSSGEPRSVKWVPHYGDDGKVAGARITGVRPDSHYERLGLKPGDVVRSIDGTAAKDPSRWPDALGPGTRPSALEVERNGEGGPRTTTLGRRG